MDWQTILVGVAILLAAGYLVWNYRRSKSKGGACPNCTVHQKVTAARRPATKD